MNNSHSRKVVLEVKGGLGNQMFQYAAARSLSLDLKAELVIEKNLGFFLDREYKRKFELNQLPIVFSFSLLIARSLKLCAKVLYGSIPFLV